MKHQDEYAAISVSCLRHLYNTSARRFVLDIPNLSIPQGEFLTCLGPSGCGKSTLLSRLGLISLPRCSDFQPARFEVVEVNSTDNQQARVHDIKKMLNSNQISQIDSLRRRLMGFYLQGGELIQTLTITENVAMPLRVNGMPAREATRTATELLGQLLNESTAKLSKKLASDYSGGEVQRVALARAIIHKPRFLFVDEPTSQLDQVSKKQVLELVKNRAKQCNMTVFMITHDEEIAREFSTCLMFLQRLPDGWNADTSSDFDRDADGYAKPVRYETLVGHQWTQTDSSFKTIVSSQQELGDAP